MTSRAKVSVEEASTTLGISVSVAQKISLRKMARDLDTSISAILREIIDEKIARHEKPWEATADEPTQAD